MLGFGPLGSSALGSLPDWHNEIPEMANKACVSFSSVIIPEGRLIVPEREVAEGTLIRSISSVWAEIAQRLRSDWSVAHQMTPRQWEEMVAGALKKYGYDEVILTPRSGDYGRDVIAKKHGVGCVKIIGSVKRTNPETWLSTTMYGPYWACCRVSGTLQRASLQQRPTSRRIWKKTHTLHHSCRHASN